MRILIISIAKIKDKLAKFFGFLQDLFAENFHYIGGPDTLPPPLKPEEELELLSHMEDKPQMVRQTLIERNLRLVVYIARKFDNTGVGLEDLISIGTIGLIKGVNTFKLDKNIKLATYASRCIENEILMHLRKTNNQKSEISIDEPLNVDWDGSELLLSDILGTEPDTVSKALDDETDRQLLYHALCSLPPREQEIMRLRFGLQDWERKIFSDERTQKEVASMLGISQSYISRLEKKIMARLKIEMEKMSS